MSFLNIGLDKPPGTVYMPGEIIHGVVTVVICQPTACEFLNVIIAGAAEVQIIEQRYGYSNRYHTTNNFIYNANETYLSHVIPLLGRTNLKAGRLQFPFQFPLPRDNLPCSFQAAYGRVYYEISAHLGTFTDFDLREAVGFTVGPYLDFNRISLEGYEPSSYIDAIEVDGGCCSKGKPIQMQMLVPKRFFIPGEIICFKVTVDNKSNRTLSGVSMRLVLQTICAAQGYQRSDEKTINAMAGPDITANSVTVWDVNNFAVPVIGQQAMPPTGLGGCGIITANYRLQFYAHGADETYTSDIQDLAIGSLIMIGTVALNN